MENLNVTPRYAKTKYISFFFLHKIVSKLHQGRILFWHEQNMPHSFNVFICKVVMVVLIFLPIPLVSSTFSLPVITLSGFRITSQLLLVVRHCFSLMFFNSWLTGLPFHSSQHLPSACLLLCFTILNILFTTLIVLTFKPSNRLFVLYFLVFFSEIVHLSLPLFYPAVHCCLTVIL